MKGPLRYKDLPFLLQWRGACLVLMDWAVILGICALASYINLWWVYLMAVPLIGGRMMGLFALLHEGHHGMLAPVRWVNDMITRYFVAWPVFRDDAEYGQQHNAHHRYLGVSGDPNFALLRYPEFTFPMPASKLALIFLLDLLCINFLRYTIIRAVKKIKLIQSSDASDGASISLFKVIFWAVLMSMLLYFGWIKEFVIFWLTPFCGWHQMAIRITLISDHCFVPAKGDLLVRSVEPHLIGDIFIAPHNLGLHAEHHFHGGIPCSDLSSVTVEIENSAKFSGRYARCTSYTAVLRELTAISS